MTLMEVSLNEAYQFIVRKVYNFNNNVLLPVNVQEAGNMQLNRTFYINWKELFNTN